MVFVKKEENENTEPVETWIVANLDRITINPKVYQGQPCIRGMRMPVYLILDLLAGGMSMDEILEAYPYLEEEDIRQSIAYAAWFIRESVTTARS